MTEWCVQCVCCAFYSHFQLRLWLTTYFVKRKPIEPVFPAIYIASQAARPMWLRNEILLGVADVNWVPYGSRPNYKVSEVCPLDTWHARPTGEWTYPGVYKQNPQVWVNSR